MVLNTNYRSPVQLPTQLYLLLPPVNDTDIGLTRHLPVSALTGWAIASDFQAAK